MLYSAKAILWRGLLWSCWNTLNLNYCNIFVNFSSWVDSTFWYKGIVVKHNGLMYRAESLTNSAEPGNKVHEYFFVSIVRVVVGSDRKTFIFLSLTYSLENFQCCFAKPGSLIYWWLGLEICVVCLQFVFLLFSTQWNHVLASCMMLLCTYYSLYKCIKNYNLCDTLYTLEDAVQTRMIASWNIGLDIRFFLREFQFTCTCSVYVTM